MTSACSFSLSLASSPTSPNNNNIDDDDLILLLPIVVRSFVQPVAPFARRSLSPLSYLLLLTTQQRVQQSDVYSSRQSKSIGSQTKTR